MKRIVQLLFFLFVITDVVAQDANPTISFYSKTEEADVTLSPGESHTTQAPLSITCTANVNSYPGYKEDYEWIIYLTDEGESSPIVNRFDQDIQYTLTRSGGYGIKLKITFSNAANDTIEYESDVFNIVISASKLSCPDGFSPNGDQRNDMFFFTMESIVKLDGAIFNRWGQKLFTFTLENAEKGWDGRQGGNYVKDGAYLLSVNAVGSDGVKYRIRKAINVLKGLLESNETSTGN